MMRRAVLTTERFTLSALTEADVDPITEACQDTAIVRWTVVPSPYTRQDAETFVSLTHGWWDDGVEAVWGIREGDVLLGTVGLHKISDGSAELGYWIAPHARGRGVITEACQAVLDFAFDGLELARVQWRAGVGNVPSARTARALGFHFEGTQRLGLPIRGSRIDAWIAGLLASDDRTPVPWSIEL